MLDFGPFPGDPDVAAARGKRVTRQPTRSARRCTAGHPGAVVRRPGEAGPFTADRRAAGTVESSKNAVTRQFDTAVSPSTGDFWRFAVAPLAANGVLQPARRQPGQTGTIAVTVKPAGARARGGGHAATSMTSSTRFQFLVRKRASGAALAYTVGK